MHNQARSEKVALLFEEAIEIADSAKRRAFLDAACAGDVALLAEVEAYMQAHQVAEGFLCQPTSSTDEAPGTVGFSAGHQLGPYRLLGLIGEGGCSTVYLAEQEEPVRRWVALKVVKPGMDTAQIISRFELERQALALMDHPGIAKVLDAGATPHGRPFFVMELVRGMPITQHCDQYRLTLPQRLELFIHVCQAVLHAHQKGIVHRDIKPDNILICLHDDQATPKIIDFGIAKVLGHWAAGNTPGTFATPFLGTPAYMSPEQAQLTRPNLDTRTDIYSLGALLYELVVGHPPFDHDALMAAGLEEMCRIIRTQEPPTPSLRYSSLPIAERAEIAHSRNTTPDELRRALLGDLDAMVLKALDKEPDRRYATAANLADDVSRHLQHLPVSATAPTFHYRFSKLVRRNRKLVLTTAAVAVVLVASAVLTGIMAVRARSSASRAQQAQQASHAAVVTMHVNSGLLEAANGNHDRALLWFANAANLAGSGQPEFHLNRQRALAWLEQVPLPIAAAQLGTALAQLEFSPDSRFLLAVDRNGTWLLIDCQQQIPLGWIGSVGPITAAAWHPGGSLLALAQADRIELRNASDGQIMRRHSTGEALTALGFTPTGTRVMIGARTILALDVRTGAIAPLSLELPTPPTAFAFARASDLVTLVSSDASARVFSAGRPAQEQRLSRTLPHRGFIRTDACASKTKYREGFLEAPTLSLPAFSKDDLLLTRTGPYEISAWDLNRDQPIQTFEGMCCSCRFVISSDGSLMACGLQNSRVGVWEIASGHSRSLLTSHGACILDVAFGPAADTLLTAEVGKTARIWSVPESKEIFSALHHSAEVDNVTYAPNGELVATAQVDGLVKLWALPRHNARGYSFAVPYGPRIIRQDPPRDHFVATKEPAWDTDIRAVSVYAAATGQLVGPPLPLAGAMQDASLAPDCRHLAVALSADSPEFPGLVQFFDLHTRQLLLELPLRSVPCALAWDPGGRQVAVICHTGELLIAAPSRSQPALWGGPSDENANRLTPSVGFTHDATTLVSLTPGGDLEVRDASTGLLRYARIESKSGGFWSFALSADSRLIATTSAAGNVRVRNLATGTQIGRTLKHPDWVYRCRFSDDGSRLLTTSHDGKCRIWDLHSGALSAPLLTHPGEVYDATFCLSGLGVLSVCRDGQVRLWDLQRGQLLAPPFHAGAQAFNVEITADGRFAVIGSLGTAIHVLSLEPWDPDPASTPQELCLVGEVVSVGTIARGELRDLTTEEWLERFHQLQNSRNSLLQTRPTPKLAARSKAAVASPVPETGFGFTGSAAPCPEEGACPLAGCPGSSSLQSAGLNGRD